jgi:hypothetical protein
VVYQASYDVTPDQHLKLVSQTWTDPSLQALNQPTATAQPQPQPRDAGATAVEAGKLVWQIIKDNRATANTTDTMTYVLSSKDTDSMNYVNAKSGASNSYTWRVVDAWDEDIVYVDIVVNARGYLHGQPVSTSPAPRGFYLPSVYFNVSKCDVDWPFTATGYANLANPVNVGTEGEAVAEVMMYAKLSAEWVFESFNITVGFKANGKTGYWNMGQV